MAHIGKDINRAIKLLEAGELVAIPTETVYGLGANALDAAAVAKVFVAKNRPHFDPLIVHVHSLERAENLVQSIPSKALDLAKRFWPGPLTLLFEKRDIVPDLVTSGLSTVGIRCPRHPLALELLHKLKFPLAAPSANPFGYVSPTSAEHVDEQLRYRVSYILDGGPCTIGIESTIVGFENNEAVVYRLGGLSLEKLEAVVGRVRVNDHAAALPIAPGQLKSHYAPRTRLVLGDLFHLVNEFGKTNVGILSFSNLFADVEKKNQLVLSPSGSLEEAAQHLFSSLRELDKLKLAVILAEEVPDMGIGKAINDRLRRAAQA